MNVGKQHRKTTQDPSRTQEKGAWVLARFSVHWHVPKQNFKSPGQNACPVLFFSFVWFNFYRLLTCLQRLPNMFPWNVRTSALVRCIQTRYLNVLGSTSWAWSHWRNHFRVKIHCYDSSPWYSRIIVGSKMLVMILSSTYSSVPRIPTIDSKTGLVPY